MKPGIGRHPDKLHRGQDFSSVNFKQRFSKMCFIKNRNISLNLFPLLNFCNPAI